jgi:hypothetical protein
MLARVASATRASNDGMSRSGGDTETGVRQRSGWLIPLGVFLVTAALSAMFLLFYLAPGPTSFIEEHPAPTSRTDPVSVTVDGASFIIPANYFIYRSARQGGAHKEVALFTTLPNFRGYSDWYSQDFTDNTADSPLVNLLIREEELNLGEAERLQRIYLNYVVDPKGKPGPFGLTKFTFRDDSGYRGEDLLVGHLDRHLVVLRCVRLTEKVPSPSCLRDVRLARGVALSYRFKRAHLVHWQDIASGVEALVRSFRTHK